MKRLVVLALVSTLVAGPAAAQVINGETPLDETKLDRPMTRPAEADGSAAPPAVAPPSAPSRDPAPRDWRD